MSVINKLVAVQKTFKCQKSQYNSFGKYRYRSCEDILEGVKPLCIKEGLLLTLSDEIVPVGNRIYVKATVKVKDIDDNSEEYATAYARESETKKGMDESQITGTASSYARKYALNGLFCIDDTKDDDFLNVGTDPSQEGKKTKKQEVPKKQSSPISENDKQAYLQNTVRRAKELQGLALMSAIVTNHYHVKSSRDLSPEQAKDMFENIDFLVETERKLESERAQ